MACSIELIAFAPARVLAFPFMSQFDLAAAAHREMLAQGFDPEFPDGTDRQVAALKALPAAKPDSAARDLRNLLWSSIDNDSSRDLDQIEVAERTGAGI